MAKTDYQEAAMNYAMDYLDRLLKMEGVVGNHVEKKLNRIVEQKFRKYIDDMKSETGNDDMKSETGEVRHLK